MGTRGKPDGMSMLRAHNPVWFKEHEDEGWGLEIVSGLRYCRWFITKEMVMVSAREFVEMYTVWEVLPGTMDIERVNHWFDRAHASYEITLLQRAQREDVR